MRFSRVFYILYEFKDGEKPETNLRIWVSMELGETRKEEELFLEVNLGQREKERVKKKK